MTVLFSARTLILQKSETTYNVSADPAASDALQVSNLTVEPLQLEREDRELVRGFPGNTPQIVTRQSVRMQFDVELATSGTLGTAPRWGPCFKACGRSETIVPSTSVTYSRVNSNYSSVTIDAFLGQQRHRMTGGRGTASYGLTAQGIPKITFDLLGIYSTPTVETYPTPTYTLQALPRAVNSDNTPTVSVHGFSSCMSEFSLEDANEVLFLQLAGCTKQVLLPNRKPSGSITIQMPLVSAKDYYTIAANQTTGPITWTHGTTAGQISTWNGPACTFGSPTHSVNDGIYYLTLPFEPQPSTGNDEDTLVLT
jgi:hypothetical protein